MPTSAYKHSNYFMVQGKTLTENYIDMHLRIVCLNMQIAYLKLMKYPVLEIKKKRQVVPISKAGQPNP